MTIATMTDPAAEIAALNARHMAVAGRASIVRGALVRIEQEINAIHESVDAEEDGIEADYARLPELRIERDRLSDVLRPLAVEEKYVTDALGSYGISV
jgi:hypothetical protein